MSVLVDLFFLIDFLHEAALSSTCSTSPLNDRNLTFYPYWKENSGFLVAKLRVHTAFIYLINNFTYTFVKTFWHYG